MLNVSGMRLGSSVFEPTTNFMTVAVDPLPNPLASVTSVPGAYRPKSTITSNRSAGAISITSCGSGAASSPPSDPICVKPLPPGGGGSRMSW